MLLCSMVELGILDALSFAYYSWLALRYDYATYSDLNFSLLRFTLLVVSSIALS